MPTDDKSRNHHDESDSEEEEEVEIVPKVDIDVTKLTPLSPEVISKQVSSFSLFVPTFLREHFQATINLGTHQVVPRGITTRS